MVLCAFINTPSTATQVVSPFSFSFVNENGHDEVSFMYDNVIKYKVASELYFRR